MGISAILVWSAACSILLFGTLWLFGQLRVSEEEEIEGMSVVEILKQAYIIMTEMFYKSSKCMFFKLNCVWIETNTLPLSTHIL